MFYFFLIVNETNLNKLESLAPEWVRKYYKGYNNGLSAFVAHLILKSTRGPKLIQILINGFKTWKDPIKLHTKFILGKRK